MEGDDQSMSTIMVFLKIEQPCVFVCVVFYVARNKETFHDLQKLPRGDNAAFHVAGLRHMSESMSRVFYGCDRRETKGRQTV